MVPISSVQNELVAAYNELEIRTHKVIVWKNIYLKWKQNMMMLIYRE